MKFGYEKRCVFKWRRQKEQIAELTIEQEGVKKHDYQIEFKC